MIVRKLTLTEAIVGQLHGLAGTPFLLKSFQEQWEAFGWQYESDPQDHFGFQVSVAREWALSVDPLGKDVLGATLPFLYWEDYEPDLSDDDDHDDEQYERGREAFDADFEAATHLTQRILGSPSGLWTDNDEERHKAAIWEGQHGLLIIQQACFDVEYGLELNFWLENCSKKEFQPTTPLIDWLQARRQRAHDERGFPALCW